MEPTTIAILMTLTILSLSSVFAIVCTFVGKKAPYLKPFIIFFLCVTWITSIFFTTKKPEDVKTPVGYLAIFKDKPEPKFFPYEERELMKNILHDEGGGIIKPLYD